MFYDLTNAGLNARRHKRTYKMKTTLGEQDKLHYGKFIEGLRYSYGECLNKDKKISNKKQNGRLTSNQFQNKQILKERNNGTLNQNTLYSLLKENQHPKNMANFCVNQTTIKPNVEKNVFYKSQINNQNYEQIPSYLKHKFSVAISNKGKQRFSQQYGEIATDRNYNRYNNVYMGLIRKKTDKQLALNVPKIKTLRQTFQSSQPKFHFQFNSIKGTKQINQDTIKTGENFWIVCDGHGQNGHHVSWYVANILHEVYNEKISKQKFSKSLLKNVFIEVQKNLQESGIDIHLSGSTCVMVVNIENKIYCACLGDSVAIAIYEDNAYEVISADHKPCNPQEAKRIQFFGGVIKKTYGKQHLPSSPLRIWGQGLENWGPGLAISRSFGDKMAQKYGLIYEPEIKQINICKTLTHIVLGSDGLFDQVKPSQMANILQAHQKGLTKTEGCKLLTEVAESRWLGYSDDISGIVIYL